MQCDIKVQVSYLRLQRSPCHSIVLRILQGGVPAPSISLVTTAVQTIRDMTAT